MGRVLRGGVCVRGGWVVRASGAGGEGRALRDEECVRESQPELAATRRGVRACKASGECVRETRAGKGGGRPPVAVPGDTVGGEGEGTREGRRGENRFYRWRRDEAPR